jgi:hypothetical protein
MRWIVIILLMCNGIYFLWQFYLVPSEAGHQVSASQQLELGESLQLISEVPADDSRVKDEKPLENQSHEDSLPPEPAVCLMIGPFKEEVTGKQVVTRLAALDIHPTMEALSTPGKPSYWVHIAPQPSRKVAIKLLRELQSKNIDSFLITKGELENGISLGIFTKLGSAEQVSSKRSGQGYDVKIFTMANSRTELWAVFDDQQTSKFSDALWDIISEGNSGLQRRKNYCDKIAPSDDFD